MKKITYILLGLIFVLGAFLRFYKLDQIPAHLNWDEAAAGYNAFTIANWGMDEYGNKFPIVFKSFGDDKRPVHVYITALIVKIFGSSDFTTRSASALLGSLSIIAIYFLVKRLTQSETSSLFAALFLALSPYSVHFSRGLWEANFALAFFLIGLSIFEKNLPLSTLSFGLSFFSYHAAEVVVPPIALLLFIFNFKKIIKRKQELIFSAVIALAFGLLIIAEPKILGTARVEQNKFSQEFIDKNGGLTQIYTNSYKQYFNPEYLFIKGDQNSRGSVKVIGEFYKLDGILAVLGIILLLFKKRWKPLFFLIFLLVLAPVPAAFSSMDTNATRSIFLIGPVLILSAIGAGSLVDIVKSRWLKLIPMGIILLVLFFESKNYINYNFNEYGKKDAIEWQYGMKQAVDYFVENPNYQKVYVDPIRQQPYIFFLYYLKYPLPNLLKSVKYNEGHDKSFNTVSSFDNFQFGGWDPIESYPGEGIYYVVTPSYYVGLRHAPFFDTKKLIKYPDGKEAFYIVTAKPKE